MHSCGCVYALLCLVYSNALYVNSSPDIVIWGYRCTVSSNLNAKNGFIHAHHHIL
uniref:Uncharacterized protein n=1 Tax=Anguilla anguilla TaxID=7936 RepID=A0A0E9T1S1_ANGAN